MKKREIIEMLNDIEILKKYGNFIIMKQEDDRFIESFEDEKRWYPNIPELKEYFDILKRELTDIRDKTNNAIKSRKTIKCSHEVRLKHHNSMGYYYECVLCRVLNKSLNKFEEPLDLDKHYISFENKYQFDYDDELYELKDGKTREELIKLILKILEKYNDEDEIDLVEELSKLNIGYEEVNLEKRSKETYILIINGTNIEYIKNNDIYISRRPLISNTIKFIECFLGLLNTRLAIVEGKNFIKDEYLKKIGGPRNKILKYDTIKDLKINLNALRDIPFKLVLDLSKLYDYKIENGNVVASDYSLNLERLFPNSIIIRVQRFNINKSDEEIKEYLLKYRDAIVNRGNFYYYNSSDNVECIDTNNMCKKLRRRLIR